MTQNQLDTLIKMANQIAANNEHFSPDDATDYVANHLRRFWARSMKQMIIDYVEQDGSQLSPVAKQAIEKPKAPELKQAG